ncbi:putative ATPase (AAA+ superfamily) [Caldisphaera lagunensis DSM 15908]|uniref:Putative ATPase (AAA+ superfamily) n=1 Tax=Caldisphaera lagunensis (strain DSM 15908 / JCM 11604 / ANMR 0165 / IC-154) TaxID=1056495 RepID=L0AAA8_CALLD|nr:ATP-binding protein [Caldisphaera lagunensis]AFZ70359.1 putative ATPase (AAA+ superfamily) [Caldisphaera lagunensis DSM 15908]
MLFDERPKENKGDLFDREKEIEEIMNNINRPLILITGVRRIGKTSILKVVLNELKIPHFIIDCRNLPPNYSKGNLYSLFSNAISSKLSTFLEILSKIRGISILGNSIELKWKGKEYVTLSDLFDHLNEKRIIIGIDEAQKLRGPLSKEIKDSIAHAYDYDRNLTFILTGSEVGLLHEFLGIENSESPLYGRYYHEITLERFDKDKSELFLRKGFEELRLNVDENVIHGIIEMFDGIPGWLALAGNQFSNNRDLKRVKNIAINVALNEINNLIEMKNNVSPVVARRYRTVMRCIARGTNSWSKIVNCIQKEEGSTISTSVLDNILNNLKKLSIIDENYEFLDPIYKEASILL